LPFFGETVPSKQARLVNSNDKINLNFDTGLMGMTFIIQI
jgi:hypothetical protein